VFLCELCVSAVKKILLIIENMIFWSRRVPGALLLPVVALMLMIPSDVLAQDHVATANDLHNELRSAARERQANIAKLERFLSSETAKKTLESVRVDPVKARTAVSLLSDQELARLAAQVDRTEFAGAGLSLTTQQVTIIIVGAILIILVAVLVSR
jgi:hypothetical protein